MMRALASPEMEPGGRRGALARYMLEKRSRREVWLMPSPKRSMTQTSLETRFGKEGTGRLST